MHRTTDEWAALLDGTTPGPWESDESGVLGPREADDLGKGSSLLAAMVMPHRQPRKRNNARLVAAAPEAVAEVIRLRRDLAADTLEYRVEHQHMDNGSWHPVTGWSPEWPLNDGHSVASNERVGCRRVSEPWEVADE